MSMSSASTSGVLSLASRIGWRALVSGSVRQQTQNSSHHTSPAFDVDIISSFSESNGVLITPLSTGGRGKSIRGGVLGRRDFHSFAVNEVARHAVCSPSGDEARVVNGAPPVRGTSSSAASTVGDEPAPLPTATRTIRSFLTVRCGLAKNMAFGASTSQDQNRYGDDACFVAKYRHTHVVGVADGVGGWWQYGYDASFFPRRLMSHCQRLANVGDFDIKQPAQLLATAYNLLMEEQKMVNSSTKPTTKSKKRVIMGTSDDDIPAGFFGSSTACVIMLDQRTSQMHTANLGDSGFIVVRDNRVVHRSEEQCHYFNAPFQLACTPPTVGTAENGGGYLSDSPASADTATYTLEEGDCILLATDGLFDNVPTEVIEAELDANHIDASSTPQTLQAVCNSLTLTARRLSLDTKRVSPFALRAREHGHTSAIGGKPDDITLIMIVVCSENV